MQNPKHIFVLWSGGMDSTFLIYDLLSKGHKVTSGYIHFQNNEIQSERELKQISFMEKYFKDIYTNNFHHLGVISTVSIEHFSNNFHLQQAGIWPLCIYSIPNSVNEIAFGYVMNDDAISYLKEIKDMFNGFKGLSYKSFKITFPLIKMSKDEIWPHLSTYLQKHVVWCESAVENDNVSCGKCNSCKRVINLGIMDKPIMVNINVNEKLENKEHITEINQT